jgi:hypothetical protein
LAQKGHIESICIAALLYLFSPRDNFSRLGIPLSYSNRSNFHAPHFPPPTKIMLSHFPMDLISANEKLLSIFTKIQDLFLEHVIFQLEIFQ